VNRVLAEAIIRGAERQRLLGVNLGPGAFVLGSGPAASVRLEGAGLAENHLRLWVGESGVKLEPLEGELRVEGCAVDGYLVLFPGQEADLGNGLSLELKLPTQQDVTKYEVGELLAEGGTGLIYSAQELNTGRVVAFKMPTPGVLEESRRLQFLYEAQVTAQLEHPGVVPVYEIGDGSEGMVYYTMKRVRGITLEKVLDLIAAEAAATVEKYPLQALVTVFLKVCETVAFAHSRGLVHRSLRPAEVTLGDFGEVLVMGWGTATLQPLDETSQSPVGEGALEEMPVPDIDVGGNPDHLSPEQLQPGEETVDPVSDVYALGAMLYRILSLRGPIEPGSEEEMRQRVLKGEFLPLKTGVGRKGLHLPGGRIPAALAAVVSRALRPVKSERYQSVAALKEDVQRYLEGHVTSAEGGGALREALLFLYRHRRGAAVVGLCAGLTLAFFTQTILAGRKAKKALLELQEAAELLKDLAEVDAQMMRLGPALKKLDQVLELKPGDLEARRRKSWVNVGLGQIANAVQEMRSVLDHAPTDRKTRRAIEILEGLETRPTHAWTLPERSLLGGLLMENELYGEALVLRAAVALSPEQRAAVVRKRVAEWLGKGAESGGGFEVGVNDKKEVELKLKEPAVARLEPLKGLPVDVLDLRGTGVTDLTPLKGMQLKRLKIDSLEVTDLGPLAGMPLEELTMSWVPAQNVEALRALPLESLDASFSGIVDFLPLYGRPLKRVRIGWPAGRVDLKFLAASPVKFLSLENAGVRDLEPLRGKPLVELDLTGNPVESLEPLEGTDLERLTFHSVAGAEGAAPLGRMPKLRELSFVWRVPRWLPEGLRNSQVLKRVWLKGKSYAPEEFWKMLESLPMEERSDGEEDGFGTKKEVQEQ
jgi:serine/threonine protein kinase